MQVPDRSVELPANRIKEIRLRKGLILSELAGALRVDQSTVYRWEQGGAIADEDKFRLAALLEVDAPYLMGWSAEEATT